jgi:lipopolysaccharide transport system ATP-binding protein
MSSDEVVISARHLGKSYTIAHQGKLPTNLREAVLHRLRHPLGNGREEHESFWALKDVNFDVRRGEVVGIIGRNGAGKSTLLKILSRITAPTTGSVDIQGRIASLLEVGTGFHPELTGRENVYLNGSILGMSRREIDRKFDEIVAFAEIERFLDTPVKRYSSGMYVRLAFAVAAHLDPEILIIDEVLSVGDSAFQRKCLGKMKDVTRDGDRTVLFVSHNLTTVRSLCGRVVWLKSGRIEWDGQTGLAIENYLVDDLGGSTNDFIVEETERHYVKETPVRLLRLIFNGGKPIRHGDPLQIDMHFRAERRIEGVGFAVGFNSLEGGRIMAVDTMVPVDQRFDLNAGDQGYVRLYVDACPLQPTRYLLDAAIMSGENVALDHLRGVAQVEVVPGDRTPHVLVGRDESGMVRMPSNVSLFDTRLSCVEANETSGGEICI